MAGAYRSSAFTCPVCAKEASLRVFQSRLVCDECAGMLLEPDDFADSIRELDGSKDELAIHDGQLTGDTCPRCGIAMHRCAVALGPHKLSGSFLHCASHGLWVPRDAMTAAYARASRRGRPQAGGGTGGTTRGYGSPVSPNSPASTIANMPSAHSGMSGAMAGIAKAFGSGAPATAGLAISQWQTYRPRAHTLFVSAHKGMPLACPQCSVRLAYVGDRWACATCSGLFVENDALVPMIQEMALSPWQLPDPCGQPGERACPVCETQMLVEVLEGATIDRCVQHGVFFDQHELEQALHHASAPPTGLGAWLKRLFKSGT